MQKEAESRPRSRNEARWGSQWQKREASTSASPAPQPGAGRRHCSDRPPFSANCSQPRSPHVLPPPPCFLPALRSLPPELIPSPSSPCRHCASAERRSGRGPGTEGAHHALGASPPPSSAPSPPAHRAGYPCRRLHGKRNAPSSSRPFRSTIVWTNLSS